MVKKLLIATFNQGKFEEYEMLFKEYLPKMKLVSLSDLKIKQKVKETGKNYKENAVLKAKFYGNLTSFLTLADDGGLEIDYLNGAPGIFSRRWPGYKATDEQLIRTVLEKLKGVPKTKRKAWLRGVLALYFPDKKKVFTFRAQIRGIILKKQVQKKILGYPFRTIFYVPSRKKLYVNFSKKEIVRFSHRTRPVKKLIKFLKE